MFSLKEYFSTASSYYDKYEPVAEQITYEAWQKILTVPLVPQAVHMATPPAKFAAEKYNYVASMLKGRGLPLTGYLPLVPIERIIEASKSTPAPSIAVQ